MPTTLSSRGGGGAALADAPSAAPGSALSQYLSFFIGGEEYAAGILRVKEIIEYDVVTRVPAMPACVRGVINLRGRVVPVIDLALTFGLPETAVTRRTCIVVVEREAGAEAVVMGVIADAVSQVLDLRADDVEAPPSFGTKARTELLDGMVKTGRKFVMLLNIDRALDLDVPALQEVPGAEGSGAGAPGGGKPEDGGEESATEASDAPEA
ncbi:MAG TPA: chemotaxis protein CheW [Gemmatimonadaceae bacterium]|nr:chemotaxis protein CheW [Gemmatimonadaceae bacterium]